MNDLAWNQLVALAMSWLLTYALHSMLLLGMAWLLTRTRFIVSYPLASILWKAALVGGLITATVQIVGGIVPLGGHVDLTWPFMSSGSVMGQAMAIPAPLPGPLTSPLPGHVLMWVQQSTQSGLEWPLWILVLWVLGVGIGLARLFIARLQLQHYLRQVNRRSVTVSPMRLTLMRLCRLARLKYHVRLTFSDQILVPVALEGGEICIPERALKGLSTAQQESMLAHELAHIVRRDADWRFAAQLMQAIFFFQPLNYIANRKLQELAEYLCDDWAVRHTRNQLSLAQCLSEVATWVQQQAHPVNLPTLTGKPSLLLNRVTRLVGKPEECHSPISEYWHIAIGISIVIIVITLAPTVSVPEAAPVPLLRQEYGNSFFYLRNGDGRADNFIESLPVPPPIPLPPELSAAGS